MQVVEVCEFPPASAHKIPLHAGICLNKIWMADCIEQINLVWLNEREWLQFTLVVCYFSIQTYNTNENWNICKYFNLCSYSVKDSRKNRTTKLSLQDDQCMYLSLFAHPFTFFPPFTGFLLSHFSFYRFEL